VSINDERSSCDDSPEKRTPGLFARMTVQAGLVRLLLLAASIIHAQSFEVASIKLSVLRGSEGGRSRIEYSPDSVTMRNVSLNDCVMWAYRGGTVSYLRVGCRAEVRHYCKNRGAGWCRPVAADASATTG
jgi:hypothetical protein